MIDVEGCFGDKLPVDTVERLRYELNKNRLSKLDDLSVVVLTPERTAELLRKERQLAQILLDQQSVSVKRK